MAAVSMRRATGKRGISPEMAVRLAKVFGGTQVRRDRIKLKRLELV